MKSFLDSITSHNKKNNLAHTGVRRVFQYVRSAVAAFSLSNGALQADELLIPPGTSIVYANAEQADFLRERSFMCHELGELGDGRKVLFVKTDTVETFTVNQGEDFPVYYYGDKNRLFARLNLTTGESETSENLVDWVISGEEEKVPVSREDIGFLSGLEQITETIENLSEQQESLANTLTTEISHLEERQHSLDVSVGDMNAKHDETNLVYELTDQKIGQQETLEITMGPESQLRDDTHPIVSSTVMSDENKTIETQEALDTYHEMITNPAQLSPMESGVQSISTLPNLADVNSTIAYLTNELNRIQGNINTVNSQIITKQNDINSTQSTIQTLQNSINQLTTQITQYANNYTYWRDEYERIIALIISYNNEVTTQSVNYNNARSVLVNVGRNDIPSDITASDVASRLIAVKSTILNEYNAVPYTPSTGPVGSDYNLPDETSSIRYYLDSQYYYVVDFPSSGKSWPGTLRVYLKLTGDSNYNQVYSSAVQNRTHAVNLFNNTARIQVEKLAQYRYVDAILENYYELYKSAQNNAAQYYAPRDTARVNRDNAKDQLDIAYALHAQRQGEMSTLQTQQTLLAQQKADLESLKSLKTNLQNLYNQVEIILNNLKNNITTYAQVTQQIQDLTSQLIALEGQLGALIDIVEDQIIVVNEQVKKVSGITTILQSTTAQISTNRESLIAMLGRNKIIKPRDGINENQLNYNQIAEYFSYAYRTSMGPVSGTKVPYRAIVEYLDNGVKEDIYPANMSYEYRISGQTYFTPAHRINNLEHKGVIAEIYKIALAQLESCLNEIDRGGDINDGMRKMWEMVEAKIMALEDSSDSNVDIREYQTRKNEIIRNILASGSSQAFFDHLMIHEANFRTIFENMLTIIANRHNIAEGSNEYADLKRALIHILSEQFGGEIVETEFAGLNTYTNYRIAAESFISIMANSSEANQGLMDINDIWSTDDHGNKYKYGLYSLGGSSTYPAKAWMEYSPDGVSTQIMGPIIVSSSLELTERKERWRKSLLHAKKSHTTYQGGAYDIFQGWDGLGGKVWWSVLLNKYGVTKAVQFNSSRSVVEKTAQEMIAMSDYGNFSSNEIFFRSLFELQYDSFERNAQASLRNLVQMSDQNLSLALGNILNYSVNVTPWSTSQKELAKVIISLTGVSGYPANDVKNFQARAIQQLDRLGADYERDIINDTIIGSRNGNMEELRTCLVLQKLSELFIAKGLEMQKIRETPTLDRLVGNAEKQSIILGGMHGGIKRFHFGLEEGFGDSNLKRNMDFIELSSLNREGRPNMLGGKAYFLGREIDLAHTGNILLGYNAKKLGLSLHETVFGSLAEQIGGDSLDAIVKSFSEWRKNIKGLEATISDLQLVPGLAIITAYENEFTDSVSYEKGFNLQGISPKILLEIITN